MLKLTNLCEAMITVHGAQQYDIAPNTSCDVDEDTKWEEHPYVIANALRLDGEREAVDDDPEQTKPEEPEPEPEPEPAKDESIEGLRREYEELTGKPADKRWGAEKLEEEIEKALG